MAAILLETPCPPILANTGLRTCRDALGIYAKCALTTQITEP
ncbi:hypothetical protein PAN31117_01605 [Pandoraea anapnoica]|uniref:Uncharacterized protein n=1 Tax=Pandoraea anapnoica TaxID=2508301 RepID=A0A5E4ZW35_9BURK|nr:hypothetical protein PAN31117_01605 [Pandoraea anapnoica]